MDVEFYVITGMQRAATMAKIPTKIILEITPKSKERGLRANRVPELALRSRRPEIGIHNSASYLALTGFRLWKRRYGLDGNIRRGRLHFI